MIDEEEEYEEDIDVSSLVIFEQSSCGEPVPDGFTATTYPLDLSPSSPLRWDIPADGQPLIFDADFGIFGPMWKGSRHASFFQSCQFALHHFVEQCGSRAMGMIFARLTLPEDPEIISYLELLANCLPSNTCRLLLLDASHIKDPFTFANEVRSDRFGPFTIAIKSGLFATKHMTWQEGPRTSGYIGKSPPSKQAFAPKTAFLLHAEHTPDFSHLMNDFFKNNRLFAVVPEEQLTAEWGGIDELLISPFPYRESTRRALDGFRAAGGVVSVVDVKGA